MKDIIRNKVYLEHEKTARTKKEYTELINLSIKNPLDQLLVLIS